MMEKIFVKHIAAVLGETLSRHSWRSSKLGRAGSAVGANAAWSKGGSRRVWMVLEVNQKSNDCLLHMAWSTSDDFPRSMNITHESCDAFRQKEGVIAWGQAVLQTMLDHGNGILVNQVLFNDYGIGLSTERPSVERMAELFADPKISEELHACVLAPANVTDWRQGERQYDWGLLGAYGRLREPDAEAAVGGTAKSLAERVLNKLIPIAEQYLAWPVAQPE